MSNTNALALTQIAEIQRSAEEIRKRLIGGSLYGHKITTIADGLDIDVALVCAYHLALFEAMTKHRDDLAELIS